MFMMFHDRNDTTKIQIFRVMKNCKNQSFQESCNAPKDFFRYSEAAARGVM